MPAWSNENCYVLSYRQDIPKEIRETLEQRGYRIYYYVLDDLSREALRSTFKLKYSEKPKGSLGGQITKKWNYALRFDGRGQTINSKDTDEDEIIAIFKEKLKTCS